jgi:hypothetical protein
MRQGPISGCGESGANRRVVVVQVRHQDLTDVARRVYAHVHKPHPYLLLGGDGHLDRELELGVGLWHVVLA